MTEQGKFKGGHPGEIYNEAWPEVDRTKSPKEGHHVIYSGTVEQCSQNIILKRTKEHLMRLIDGQD